MPQNWFLYHGPDCLDAECRRETRRIASDARRRPPIPQQIREAVVARDGLQCCLCGVAVVRRGLRSPYQPDTLHLDHIELRSQGGADSVDNLRVLCANCNLRRSKR